MEAPGPGNLARCIRGARPEVGRAASALPCPLFLRQRVSCSVSMVAGDGIPGGRCPRRGQALARPAPFDLCLHAPRSASGAAGPAGCAGPGQRRRQRVAFLSAAPGGGGRAQVQPRAVGTCSGDRDGGRGWEERPPRGAGKRLVGVSPRTSPALPSALFSRISGTSSKCSSGTWTG